MRSNDGSKKVKMRQIMTPTPTKLTSMKHIYEHFYLGEAHPWPAAPADRVGSAWGYEATTGVATAALKTRERR
jgi:hypothetical protein